MILILMWRNGQWRNLNVLMAGAMANANLLLLLTSYANIVLAQWTWRINNNGQ